MKIENFKLERYFAKHEFSAKYMLSSSDCESLAIQDLLKTEDDVKLFLNERLGYTETQGNIKLRQEISKIYKGLDINNILVAAPEEAIFLTLNSLLKKSDHVIHISPIYQSLMSIPKSIGCELSKWELRLNENQWEIDVDKLEDLIKSNTKMIVFNFPHNPTGFNPTLEQLNKIVDIARKHNIIIFSDEMYRFLEYDGNTLPSLVNIYEKAVVLSGLSKAYGLPGLRVGWIASKMGEIFNDMLVLRDYTTICNSHPSELLAIKALENGRELTSACNKTIKENKKIMELFFKKHENLFQYNIPKAGPIAFHKIKNKLKIEEFCNTILKELSIMIVPDSMFNMNDNLFRIGFGRKNFKEVIDHLDLYLSKCEI